MAAPFQTPIVCPVLIGRERQFDLLLRLVDQVRTGQGHTALIAGEAGIGKSRLVAELKPAVTSQGLTMLQGRCFELDRVLPYAPLVDLLRSWLAGRAHVEHAATLLAAAHTILERFRLIYRVVDTSGYTVYMRRVEAVRARLSEQSFVRAWDTGRAMTTVQAIAFATPTGAI
jgi:hypothetical protein